MRVRVGGFLALVLCTAVVVIEPAWATIDNLKSYKQAYPGKDAKAYTCKVCHQGAVGKKGDLNAYGAALEQLKGPGHAKKLTEADFRALEQADADQDGVSNLDEITAGTAPGEAAVITKGSKPTGQTGPGKPEDSTGQKKSPGDSSRVSSEALEAWAEPAAGRSNEERNAPARTEPEAPRAEYVGMETCAACHAKQAEEFKHSTHARIAIPGGAQAQGCETCHGPGSLHAAAGGGRGVGGIINPRKDPSTCFACHLDKKTQFRLPYHHPVLEGKVSCADCHSAHGPEVRPWSATTLKDINEACFKCHKEQRGPFVWEHEALREGCTSCHQVHGSVNQKMLLARDNNLCLRCHAQVNFPTIGNSSHSGRFLEGTCFSGGCHTAPHGSNFSDHLRY